MCALFACSPVWLFASTPLRLFDCSPPTVRDVCLARALFDLIACTTCEQCAKLDNGACNMVIGFLIGPLTLPHSLHCLARRRPPPPSRASYTPPRLPGSLWLFRSMITRRNATAGSIGSTIAVAYCTCMGIVGLWASGYIGGVYAVVYTV